MDCPLSMLDTAYLVLWLSLSPTKTILCSNVYFIKLMRAKLNSQTSSLSSWPSPWHSLPLSFLHLLPLFHLSWLIHSYKQPTHFLRSCELKPMVGFPRCESFISSARLGERLAPSVLTSTRSGYYTFYRLRPSAEQILNKEAAVSW